MMLREVGERVDINISLRDFPTKFRFSTYNVVAQNGATWFFVPPVCKLNLPLMNLDDYIFYRAYGNSG
jgi:hypothetical protein